MKGRTLSRVGYLLGVLLAVSAMSFAGTSKSTVQARPTKASSTWDTHKEATDLLSGIETDSRHIATLADEVIMLRRQPAVAWTSHGSTLMEIREAVNDMGMKLSRLETIRSSALPWQQQAIDRVAPLVRLTADNVQDAILFLNANQHGLWKPEYGKYTRNMAAEAGQIATSVREFETYANARQREMQLGKDLGMSSGS